MYCSVFTIATPYFAFTVTIQDSAGLNSTNKLSYVGTIFCNPGRHVSSSDSALCADPIAYNLTFLIPYNRGYYFQLQSNSFVAGSPTVNGILTLPQNGSLSYSSTNNATIGSSSLQNVYLIYTPVAGYIGNDSFTYYGINSARSNNATVNFTIYYVKDPPLVNPSTLSLSIYETPTKYGINLRDYFTDSGETLYFVIYFITAPIRGTWTVSNNSTINFSLPLVFNASDNMIIYVETVGPGGSE